MTGWRVLGRWEEPRFCTLFGHPMEKRSWLTIPEHLDDFGIVAAYRSARTPQPRDAVVPVVLTRERIDELYEHLTTNGTAAG